MLNRTEANLFIDSLSFLVADKSNGAEQIENFFNTFPEAKLEINTRSPQGTKIVESAARSGSVSSLQYLIENLKANIEADEMTPNLVEIALNNPAARNYLLSEDKQLWLLFADGTTDFLAHVMAGRLQPALEMLNGNPGLICSMNIRCQNALYWSHVKKLNAAVFKKFAENYGVTQAGDYQALAQYHATMGYFKLLYQFPQKPSIALEQFETSIVYYKKTILENEHNPQVIAILVRELALVLLYSARACSRLANSQSGEFAKFYIERSDVFCLEAIAVLRSMREHRITDMNFILNSLLREHAENSYLLDNSYYAQGDVIKTDPLDALAFYKKAIVYGEAAVRALGDITLKTAKDFAALTKCCDKLTMSYGAAKICHQLLMEEQLDGCTENTAVIEFHVAESKRYQDLMKMVLNRNEDALPGNIVILRSQSPKFFGRHLNGLALDANGTNVLHAVTPAKTNGKIHLITTTDTPYYPPKPVQM